MHDSNQQGFAVCVYLIFCTKGTGFKLAAGSPNEELKAGLSSYLAVL